MYTRGQDDESSEHDKKTGKAGNFFLKQATRNFVT
jgi:hypothetical protein